MKKDLMHVCDNCLTKHFSEEEKNKTPHPSWDGAEIHVCKKCGHDTFFAEPIKPIVIESITKDGVQLEDGDFYFGVAIQIGTNKFVPIRNLFPDDEAISIVSQCYSTRALCIAECDARMAER